MKGCWLKARFIPLLAALALAGACASSRIRPHQEYGDTLTHAGVIGDLAKGHYDGFFAVSNLYRYGNHGLGTFDRLDGEMILHSGIVYRADADGFLSLAGLSNSTPYAVVTYFEADRMFDIENVDLNRFQRALDMHRDSNVPDAIQVNGIFSHIKIRSVPAQEKPYQSLEQTLAASSRSHVLTNVAGVMVGFYMPADLDGLHPAGYHFHFMDAGRKVGGHVLDYVISMARIHVDSSPNVQAFLSTNRPAVRPPWPTKPPQNRHGNQESGSATGR